MWRYTVQTKRRGLISPEDVDNAYMRGWWAGTWFWSVLAIIAGVVWWIA